MLFTSIFHAARTLLLICLIMVVWASLLQTALCNVSSPRSISLSLIGDITPINNLTPLIQLAREHGVKVINITIDSPGGNVNVTREMITEIEHAQRNGIKVNCHVTAQAASAAFLLYAICNTRTALATSSFMWHAISVTLDNQSYSLLELQALLSYLEVLQYWANAKIQARLKLNPLLFQKLWMSEMTLSGRKLKTLAPHYLTLVK